MSVTPAALGAALLRRRRELGMSQVALAKRLGFSDSNVSRMERGIVMIPAHRFIEWCRILRLKVEIMER